ncbi:hypothetical protein BDW68DRAFT_157791, partial [Aspergillus falconensis]
MIRLIYLLGTLSTAFNTLYLFYYSFKGRGEQVCDLTTGYLFPSPSSLQPTGSRSTYTYSLRAGLSALSRLGWHNVQTFSFPTPRGLE